MNIGDLVWNKGLNLGSETAVIHRITGDTVLITSLADGTYRTQGFTDDRNDHARLTEADLVLKVLGECEPHPEWNDRDFPRRDAHASPAFLFHAVAEEAKTTHTAEIPFKLPMADCGYRTADGDLILVQPKQSFQSQN